MTFLALLLAVSATTAAPEITEIRLERTPCFGGCPVDEVILRPDGTATYVGKRFVDRIGRYRGTFKRERFDRCMSIEHATLDYFVEDVARLLRSVGVQLDSIAPYRGSLCERVQSRSGSRTWIENAHGFIAKLKVFANSSGFGIRKRVIAKFQLRSLAHPCISLKDRQRIAGLM